MATMTESKTCDERKAPLRLYPYTRPKGPDAKRPEGTWVLIVCPTCHANEILPILYDKSTTVTRKFARQIWQRFHGFTRSFTVTDTKGKPHEEVEAIPASWGEHPCLPDVSLKELIGTTPGKLVVETVTVERVEDE